MSCHLHSQLKEQVLDFQATEFEDVKSGHYVVNTIAKEFRPQVDFGREASLVLPDNIITWIGQIPEPFYN